jgi:putative spermidine/putrescine transport system substrate-binding protein
LAVLAELEPVLWRGGEQHPADQAELDRLFAAGEVDLTMSYNPNFVDIARFAPTGVVPLDCDETLLHKSGRKVNGDRHVP